MRLLTTPRARTPEPGFEGYRIPSGRDHRSTTWSGIGAILVVVALLHYVRIYLVIVAVASGSFTALTVAAGVAHVWRTWRAERFQERLLTEETERYLEEHA